jgi:hypothetical protein
VNPLVLSRIEGPEWAGCALNVILLDWLDDAATIRRIISRNAHTQVQT